MNFINFLKGIAISISQLIPGVSGGTIAIILGIYDKLLHAVNNILKDFKNQYKLLLEVGFGAVVGILLFSSIIEVAFNKYPIQLGYLFIGIILGGAPLMYKKSKIKKIRISNVLYFISGFIIVYFMGKLNSGVSDEIITTLTLTSTLLLFLGGILIAVALILPGISGSFMLYVLGLYGTVLSAINQRNIIVLIPLLLGGIAGTLMTSNIIEKLLLKYPEQTYILIFGFILGSVFSVFPGFAFPQSIVGIILGILGFIFIYKISKE